MERPDQRTRDQLRPISFLPNVAPHATGSVLVSFGHTKVICAATIEDGVPSWMRIQKVPGGWLTAEYNMLPYSTLSRKPRDSTRGRIDGRSSEIQRLIGRSLRAVIDLKALGPRTVRIDCDVLQADGGTRTASISGACVAVAIAINALLAEAKLKSSPMRKKVAAVSAGVYAGQPCLDLNYIEDRDATVDCNVVMTEDLEFVEVQGTGEEATYSLEELQAMLELSRSGIQSITVLQEEAIREAETRANEAHLEGLAEHFKKISRLEPSRRP